MSQKYLILKRKIPKAHGGWGSNLVRQSKLDIESSVDVGFQAAQIGSDFLFNNASEKNSRLSGFGTEIYDDKDAKLEVGRGAVSGGIEGAKLGTSILPGWGTAIGFGVGAIAGAFGGKKKAKEEKASYEKLLGQQLVTKGRQEDIRNSQALMGQDGTKLNCGGGKMACGGKNLGRFIISRKKANSLILRNGGKLEQPGAVNVVVEGKLHKENNNLGNKDKGIPVIDSEGNKEYEVEAGEVIFRQDITNVIEKYADTYKETNEDLLLPELGQIIAKELLNNTQDNYGKFGVKVK